MSKAKSRENKISEIPQKPRDYSRHEGEKAGAHVARIMLENPAAWLAYAKANGIDLDNGNAVKVGSRAWVASLLRPASKSGKPRKKSEKTIVRLGLFGIAASGALSLLAEKTCAKRDAGAMAASLASRATVEGKGFTSYRVGEITWLDR